MSMRKTVIIGLLLIAAVVAVSSPARAGLIIGGWDATRGGSYSIRDGFAIDLQAAIATNFPGATVTATSTLTSSYLSTVNVLFVSSIYNGNNLPIAPLSAAEQTALLNFVLGGGSAILVGDNGVGYFTASNSLTNPFGVHVTTAIIDGIQAGTVTNSSHPVTNGPFGVISHTQSGYPGFFDNLGSYATTLATLDANGAPVAAVIDRGALGSGSGAVVLFSDGFPIDRFSATPDNSALTLNAIAFAAPSAVPEPSSLVMLGMTGAGWCVWRRVRRYRQPLTV